MRRLLFFCFTSLALVSCTSDDDEGVGNPEGDYYPVAVNDYWTYTVEAANSGRDSLYISGTVELDGRSYLEFGAREPVYGLYTLLVRNNQIRVENGKVYIRGTLEGFREALADLQLELDDVLVLDPSLGSGALLTEISQEVTQPYGEYEITAQATIRTEMMEEQEAVTVNGITYTDVVASVLTVRATAGVSGNLDGIDVTVPVLAEQEVLRMELYFAEGVGLISTQATLQYELSNTDLVNLNLPDTFSEEIAQKLDGYSGELP